MSKLVVGVSLISGVTSLFNVSATVENIEERRFEEQSYLRSLSEEDRRIYMEFAKRIEEKRNGSRIEATKKQEEKEISHMPAKPIKTVVARKVAPKPSSGPVTPSKTTPVVNQKPEVVEIKVEEKAPKTEVRNNPFAHLKSAEKLEENKPVTTQPQPAQIQQTPQPETPKKKSVYKAVRVPIKPFGRKK